MLIIMIAFSCLVAIVMILPSFVMLRNRYRGAALVMLAPMPGALIVGVFTALYLSRIGSDVIPGHRPWGPFLILGVPSMLAAWSLGLVLCVIWLAMGRTIRSTAGKGTRS